MENNPKRNAEYYPDPTAYQAIRNVEPQRFPFMPVVYVCSPYAGDVEENIRKACAYCRKSAFHQEHQQGFYMTLCQEP